MRIALRRRALRFLTIVSPNLGLPSLLLESGINDNLLLETSNELLVE